METGGSGAFVDVVVDGEAEPVPVKLGVWLSNTKSRRDKLTAQQLAALAALGMEWAGPAAGAARRTACFVGGPDEAGGAGARGVRRGAVRGRALHLLVIERFGPPYEREGYGTTSDRSLPPYATPGPVDEPGSPSIARPSGPRRIVFATPGNPVHFRSHSTNITPHEPCRSAEHHAIGVAGRAST
ncbi:hypothetical protein [Streptomyces sp. SR-10]|uniref:hypothetical protein n=1 Tax=Streptomyces sp. SR-10 TaxID=3416442 RepID=UPI003CEEAA34